MVIKPDTEIERVALVIWYLSHGMTLSLEEVRRITGQSRRGARAMLAKIAQVTPIREDAQGHWRVERVATVSGGECRQL